MSTSRSEEMAALFHRAEREGWTNADVAEAAGVTKGTAVWWKRKLRQSGELAKPGMSFSELVPIDAHSDERCGDLGCVLRCELPSGIRVEVEATVYAAAELLKSLAC